MFIFPAIDLIEGCAVRLVRGDYAQKTVYSDNPAAVAQSFAKAGAEFLHLVDLEGAKDGTAAITQPDFLENMVAKYGEKIAVGVDIKDGMVAIKGWTEVSAMTCDAFCEKLEKMGVKTIICTDISKDGLLSGTNLELYRHLGATYHMDIVASGGVSSLEDVAALEKIGLYGAILGKALYTGHIDLAEAVKLAKGERK